MGQQKVRDELIAKKQTVSRHFASEKDEEEDREDFILRTGAGATKFNKWMKKAGLFFNKQTGRWTRHKDMR